MEDLKEELLQREAGQQLPKNGGHGSCTVSEEGMKTVVTYTWCTVIIKCVEMRHLGLNSVLQRNYIWRNCIVRKESVTRRTLWDFTGQTIFFFKDEEMNTAQTMTS